MSAGFCGARVLRREPEAVTVWQDEIAHHEVGGSAEASLLPAAAVAGVDDAETARLRGHHSYISRLVSRSSSTRRIRGPGFTFTDCTCSRLRFHANRRPA